MPIVGDLWTSVPPVTRFILLVCIVLTGAVSLDLCTPFKLYFNYNLIKRKYQVLKLSMLTHVQFWRIFTCLFYFGEFSVDVIFDFCILYRYSSMLESDSFRNKPAEFILFFVFGCCIFILTAIFLGLEFLSPCLSSMMLYLWCRRNPNFNLNMLEIFHFRAPFLPWFLMLFVVMFGFNPKYDIIGAFAGHLYYYLEDIVPKIPETRNIRVLKPPKFLVRICELLKIHDYQINQEDFVFEDDPNAVNGEGQKKIEQKRGQTSTSFPQLLLYASVTETVFYLPNRFRQILLLNTQNVAFTSTENTLLSLMSIVFNLQNSNDMEFKIRQVLSCYKLFFASTLLYESLAITSRLKLFEKLNSDLSYEGKQSTILNGFLTGAAVQYALSPLFKLSIANHNYKLSDSKGFKEFFVKSKAQSTFDFMFKTPLSVVMRGGVLGLIQLSFFKKAVSLFEDPMQLQAVNINKGKSLNEQTKEFMNTVDDNNEILNKLLISGYFDQKIDFDELKGIHSYKNLLMSSFLTALLMSLILTPIDLVVFNVQQTRLYGPKSLKGITFKQVAKEIGRTQGLGTVFTMLFLSSFVRNLFGVTSIYCLDNYHKSQLLSE